MSTDIRPALTGHHGPVAHHRAHGSTLFLHHLEQRQKGTS
jgi:hypothetical protein